MKKASFLTPFISIVAFASMVIVGCKKEHSDTLTPAEEEQAVTVSVESETQTELVFNDVFDNVMGASPDVAIGGTGVFGRAALNGAGKELNMDSLPPCLTVTTVHLNANPNEYFPVRITLDFGASCHCSDGHTRSGKIITVYTGNLRYPGKSASTTFDGFRIDSFTIANTTVHSVVNTGTAQQNQFTVTVSNAKISTPSGNYSEWESQRVITHAEGYLTPNIPLDDVFSITGSAHGHVKRGNMIYAWHSEITDPLRKRFVCHWISKGVIRVTRETLPSTSPWVATLNYGNGDCDFYAILTINGVSHPIVLPH